MWWFKALRNGHTVPVVQGPYETQAEAEAVKVSWATPPEGDPPVDLGEVAEGGLEYPDNQLRIMGRVAISDIDHILYSDGTTVPVE